MNFTRRSKILKYIFAAGGTGGHIFPAMAVAQELNRQNPNAHILFLGTRKGPEWDIIPKYGYNLFTIWISGWDRKYNWKLMRLPLQLLVSLIQCFFLVLRVRPKGIFCFGSYVSLPIGWISCLFMIPLFLQEQNAVLGLSTKLLKRHAQKIFLSFKESARYFANKEKIQITGNPICEHAPCRSKNSSLDLFLDKIDTNYLTLLILGGSGGALAINNYFKKNTERIIKRKGINIIWQCGSKYYNDLCVNENIKLPPQVNLIPFIQNMKAAYNVADVVCCRSGAMTCAELAYYKKPSILIPSTNVTNDHQMFNAKIFENRNACTIVTESNLEKNFLPSLFHLLDHALVRKNMAKQAFSLSKPNAAKDIVMTLGQYYPLL